MTAAIQRMICVRERNKRRNASEEIRSSNERKGKTTTHEDLVLKSEPHEVEETFSRSNGESVGSVDSLSIGRGSLGWVGSSSSGGGESIAVESLLGIGTESSEKSIDSTEGREKLDGFAARRENEGVSRSSKERERRVVEREDRKTHGSTKLASFLGLTWKGVGSVSASLATSFLNCSSSSVTPLISPSGRSPPPGFSKCFSSAVVASL